MGVDIETPIESSDGEEEEEELEENSSWQLDGTYGSSFSNGQAQRDANWCLPLTPPHSGTRLDLRDGFLAPDSAKTNMDNKNVIHLGAPELSNGQAEAATASADTHTKST